MFISEQAVLEFSFSHHLNPLNVTLVKIRISEVLV
jgi:hypothetical protein